MSQLDTETLPEPEVAPGNPKPEIIPPEPKTVPLPEEWDVPAPKVQPSPKAIRWT